MDVMSRSTIPSSSLNPNAPLFVPMAYQTVEDYSDEWWALIQSAPWFRDYWLRECFQDPQNAPPLSEMDDPFLPDVDALFDDYISNQEEVVEEEEGEGEKEGYVKDLVSFGSSKWRKSRSETARNIEKVPKIVNVKVNPRPIQQPR